MLRSRLGSWLGVLLLSTACSSGEPPAQEPAAATPERSAPAGPHDAGLRLQWSFGTGEQWQEQVRERMFLLRHPKQSVDPEQPVMLTEIVERFEVLEATDTRARLSRTPVSMKVTIHEGGREESFDQGTAAAELRDGLAAQKLAHLDVPLVASITSRGAVEQVHDAEAYVAAVRTRFEALAGAQPPQQQEDARAALEIELRSLAVRVSEQGLRPPLPSEPVVEGTSWTQRMRVPSLFQATVRYEIQYEVSSVTPTMVVVALRGEGTLEPTPAMATVIGESELGLHGHLWIDPQRGVLLEHEEIMEMSVEFRPHPLVGEGGTMASRLERRRTRLEPTGEGAGG
ncbi:MAG: hypothetical protein H6712_11245 [Myxococcales bacterium]|nr:hypothetical protein [Myxococcales bacterium]